MAGNGSAKHVRNQRFGNLEYFGFQVANFRLDARVNFPEKEAPQSGEGASDFDSDHTTANRFLLCMNLIKLATRVTGYCLIGAAALTALAFTPSSLAQGEKIVREIDVQYVGNAAVSKERILAQMSTKVGQPMSAAQIDEDIKNLYATGEIENIRVLSKPVSGGVKLLLVVQTRSILGGVAFTGNSVLTTDKLENAANLKFNRSIDEAAIREGQQKIQDLYRKRGYPDATVSYSVSAPDRQGLSTVTYKINEGGQAVLRNVTFVGNSVFSSAKLRQQMEQRPKSVLNPFRKAGRMDDSNLEEDVRAIEDYYQNAGYLNAHVVNVSRVRAADGQSVDLVITIDEGTAYRIASVSVEGVKSISLQNDLSPYLKVRTGGDYSGQALKDDIKLIQDQYGAKGYADARVTPKLDPAGPNAVRVSYLVDEGSSYTIGQIHVEGNTKTLDRVIRRELAVAPGQPFDTGAIEASRNRLMNLNYFATVDVMPVDTGSYVNEKDLVITVTEKPTGTINFGAGFSSIDDLVGFVEVSQTNFDITNWPSLTGAGQRFRVGARVGTRRKDFSIALTEPWFMGKRLALTGEFFYRDLLFLSDYYDQTEIGGAVSLRKPLGEFAYGNLEVKPQNIDLSVDNNASEALMAEEGSFTYIPISLDLVHDTRDSVYLPREGHRLSGGVEQGIGGDVDATTFSASASQHFLLPWDTILSVQGKYANVSGADHIFTRQFLGGANTMRGFDYRDVGPKDENGEPLGGDEMWFLSAEYTFPIVPKIRGALFYDMGEVSGGPGTEGGGVNSDFGFGLRLFILGGAPVKLDYGIPIDADQFNDDGGRFNFTIGYQF